MTAAPEMLAPSPEFPVAMDQPGDELLFWEQERTHAPNPVAPLEYDLLYGNFMRGMTRAFQKYEIPVAEMRSRRLNTYLYTAMVPMRLSPQAMEARERAVEAQLFPAIARVGELWRDELLPEVRRHLEAVAARDLGPLSDAELREALGDVIERGVRLGEIHFEIVIPAYLAVSEFEEMYNELFSPEDRFEPHRLLQGLPNKTTEFGHELWSLSRVARQSPVVRQVLEREPAEPAMMMLRCTFQGRAFLAELDGYLEQYGHRSPFWGITGPTWIEDPAPVIKNLKDYISQPDSAGPELELERLAEEREAAIAGARERLAGYPAPVREQFEVMLRAAQDGLVITEDHGFYIDSAGLSHVRRAVVEAGRRLALVGAIGSEDDVFMLHADELLAALADPAGADYRDTVAERRREMERYAAITPPPVLGSPPPGPPPDSPMTRFVAKFGGAPPAPSEAPNEINGSPGSAGKVVGVARVVTSLEDAARLQPGEVLVAATTAPPWTPLFATAAAVVTDTGGILSHCAVVAREYAIPAVVGAVTATATIRDGQTVEVDGNAGVVRILE